MVAVLVCAPGLITMAWIARVAFVLPGRVPTLHRPVPLLYDPWLGVAVTKRSPLGSRSAIATLVAASGPLLLSVTVKVTVSPTLGVASLTDLLNARSACCGVSVALAVLLPAL